MTLLPKDPIRSWLIGALAAITMPLASIAYAGVINRISTLEESKDTYQNQRVADAVQIGELKSQIAVLQQQASTANASLARIESTMDVLVNNARADSLWRAETKKQAMENSRRWNDAMDQRNQKPKK